MDSSKIKEYGNIEFKRIFNLLNEELNYKYKISFYNLLYGDLIKISPDIDLKNKKIDIEIENSYDFLYDHISDSYSKLDINNNNIIQYFKKELINTKKDVKNKIIECENDMKLLNNLFIEETIEKFIPKNSTNKLNFNNKKVLYIKDKDIRFRIGEFFIRYLFISSEMKNNELNNHTKINESFSPSNFFSPEKLTSFMILPSDYNYTQRCYQQNGKNYNTNMFLLNEFSKINNHFKYWYLFVLSNTIFDDKSNYDNTFNLNILKKFINNLFIEKKAPNKKSKKGKKGKKGKKSSKGTKSHYEILEGIFGGNKKKQHHNKKHSNSRNNKNTSNKKESYDKIQEIKKNILQNLENIIIIDKNNKNKDLLEIYLNPYKINLELFSYCL